MRGCIDDFGKGEVVGFHLGFGLLSFLLVLLSVSWNDDGVFDTMFVRSGDRFRIVKGWDGGKRG